MVYPVSFRRTRTRQGVPAGHWFRLIPAVTLSEIEHTEADERGGAVRPYVEEPPLAFFRARPLC